MNPKQILIIEDEPDARETLSYLLESKGYVVTSAENGRVALDLLNEGLMPSVILLDLTLPVMDGWEFRTLQLADPILRSIPVIVTTAMPPDDVGVLVGVPIIQKPVDLDRLLGAIRERVG